MKILPEKEFRELAVTQQFSNPELAMGFIDKYTFEATVPTKASTRVKLHELGHEELEHAPKAFKYYGKGRKDILKVWEPWSSAVDDEIEAEIYSFRKMGKKVTPMVGMNALRFMLDSGYKPQKAFSLVIGRLGRFGIHVSYEDRKRMVRIVEKGRGVEIQP